MRETNNSVISSFIWKFGERICAQSVSIIVSTILARILLPEAFGLVTMVNIFITIANVFVSDNLGSALIQKTNTDLLDFNSIFYISFLLSTILYCGLFIAAPWLAEFYHESKLSLILRVFALKLPISAVNTIQHAYVAKKMIFRKFFFSTLIGTVLSGVLGVITALRGYGVWALIFQYLSNTLIDSIVLFVIVPWRPGLEFSFQRAKSLLGYGWKVLMTGLVSTIYGQLRGLVIGKVYTADDLAYYSMGERFPALISNNVDVTIGSVLFPAMSNVNDNISQVKEITRKAMRLHAYIIFPLLTGLAIIGESLVQCLLTDKWISSLFFLYIFCFEKGTSPFSTANLQAIKAIGRSDILLKIELIKKSFGILAVLFALHYGVYAIGYSCIIVACAALLINMVPNGKLLGYPMWQQIKDIIPILLLSFGMAIPTIFVLFCGKIMNFSYGLLLCITIPAGVAVYIILSRIFLTPEYIYLVKLFERLKRRYAKCE